MPERNKDGQAVLLLVAGPSGVGKDSIINQLRWRVNGLHVAVTATTREPRPRETNGKDYYFLSEDEFANMQNGDKFLESACVYGEWYGVPRLEVEEALDSGMDVLIRVDLQGIQSIAAELPQACLVYIMPGNLMELESRLGNRATETPEDKKKRLEAVTSELRDAMRIDFDYIVTNRENELDQAVETLRGILLAERCRVR